jgi:hypothetical protein
MARAMAGTLARNRVTTRGITDARLPEAVRTRHRLKRVVEAVGVSVRCGVVLQVWRRGRAAGGGSAGSGAPLAGKLGVGGAFALCARDEGDRFQCSLRPGPAAAGGCVAWTAWTAWTAMDGLLGWASWMAVRFMGWGGVAGLAMRLSRGWGLRGSGRSARREALAREEMRVVNGRLKGAGSGESRTSHISVKMMLNHPPHPSAGVGSWC